MLSVHLAKKEIRYFFSSLIGTVVLLVFLSMNSLFLWLIPINEYLHIPTTQYASLEPLFTLAPWMYLFLIPAICMRSFSDEKAAGTMEFLLTKPISVAQIITGKFLACITILILSLLPTLVYVYFIHYLGYPQGNFDLGGTIGSYIGLVLLGIVFISIGLFASALTNNQISALLLAVVLCVLMYLGMDWLASFVADNAQGAFIQQFGIQEHYNSISRGVIEFKSISYFIVSTSIFLLLTKYVIIKQHKA